MDSLENIVKKFDVDLPDKFVVISIQKDKEQEEYFQLNILNKQTELTREVYSYNNPEQKYNSMVKHYNSVYDQYRQLR